MFSHGFYCLTQEQLSIHIRPTSQSSTWYLFIQCHYWSNVPLRVLKNLQHPALTKTAVQSWNILFMKNLFTSGWWVSQSVYLIDSSHCAGEIKAFSTDHHRGASNHTNWYWHNACAPFYLWDEGSRSARMSSQGYLWASFLKSWSSL